MVADSSGNEPGRPGAYTRLTAAEVAVLVAHLAPRITGAFTQKIREPDEHTVVFSVRSPGVTTHIVLSCHPSAPRLGVASGASTTRPEPSTLGRWLRSVAMGKPILGLEQVGHDRVVALRFPGGRLVAELGGLPNLFALDEADRIKAVAHHPPPGARDLRPGRTWAPPAMPEGAGGPVRFATPEDAEQAALAHLGGHQAATADRTRDSLVARTRKRLEKLRKNVEGDVARTQDAQKWKRYGELLVSQRGLKRGLTETTATDWATGETVTLPLDPALDGAANAARYFERYRKAKAGTEKAQERLGEVEAALARLEALAQAHPDGIGLEAALVEAGLHRPPQAPPRRREQSERLPYRPYTSVAGEEIRVGRGGVDNHTTTFHHARGNDRWLHVRDTAGAHVIIPVAKGKEPHPETVRDAAALAIHHSKLRGEPGAEVMITERKHVHPVTGGAPGLVTVAASRTVTVGDLAERVARLEPRGT